MKNACWRKSPTVSAACNLSFDGCNFEPLICSFANRRHGKSNYRGQKEQRPGGDDSVGIGAHVQRTAGGASLYGHDALMECRPFKLVLEKEFDAIICDLSMPQLEGDLFMQPLSGPKPHSGNASSSSPARGGPKI